MENFREKVERALLKKGPLELKYNESEFSRYGELYSYLDNYACEHCYYNMAVALPLVRSMHDGIYRGAADGPDGKCDMPFVFHCLTVARTLIDLHTPLTDDEQDVLYAGALCHDLVGHGYEEAFVREVMNFYGMDSRVFDVIRLLEGRDYLVEKKHLYFFEQIIEENNRLALLVKLADCTCVIEQLYNAPVRTAIEYIYQTRMTYMPMCIRTKELYPELYSAAGILMEKMRSLCEVTEILVNRYIAREEELNSELLELKDENISLRRAISKAEGK